MSSVKRWAEENGLLPHHDQMILDAYYDDDGQQFGYRFPNDDECEQRKQTVTITIEMPTADAEALYRFLKSVKAREQCPTDPYEASRLEAALEALAETMERDPKSA